MIRILDNRSAADEWRCHWPLVLAASIGFSFHSLMTTFSGLYLEPVANEFAWSRAQVTSGMSLSAVFATLASPFFGILIDRWGTRRLALPGLVTTALVIAAFGLMSHSLFHWILMWMLYAMVGLAVKSTIWTAAISGVFDRGRGLALGVVLSGNALTQIVVPPLGNALIEIWGWRAAFVTLGLGWGGIAFLLSWFFLYDLHDHWRNTSEQKTGESRPDVSGLTPNEALHQPAIWRIGASTLITMFFTVALAVHLFPIMTAVGIERSDAAWMMSLAGVAAIVGKTTTGVLMDQFSPGRVGGLVLMAGAVAFALLLWGSHSVGLIMAAIIINGFTAGTKLQICSYLTSRYAGFRHFGVIFGVMASLIALGSGLGPVIGGMFFDVFGDYQWFLVAGFAGSLLSGFIIFGLPVVMPFAQTDQVAL